MKYKLFSDMCTPPTETILVSVSAVGAWKVHCYAKENGIR